MKKILSVLLLVAILLIAGCSQNDILPEISPTNKSDAVAVIPIAEPDPLIINYSIISPYSAVDWQSYGQYKTALHVHTTNSDGNDIFSDMIEDHYQKDYDIVAVTDHNALTADWISAQNGLTQTRLDEITAGEGRNGRGMIQIPYTNEQSVPNHLNSFFTDYNNPETDVSLEQNIAKVEELGGLSHINHPGRYTGGREGGEIGKSVSNDPETINKYVDLFIKYPTCTGMEIINKKDEDSASDRILWDNILMKTIPKDRYVWGFSSDDTHNIADTGFSFNIFVMPANTLENFRQAMTSGSFYAVAKVSKRELGDSFIGSGLTPVIKNIKVDSAAVSITVTVENSDRIVWISNGKIVAVGDTINIRECENIGSYIRANISGPGGIAFTQPFGIKIS